MHEDLRPFMVRAIAEAARSPEGGARVGAVLVRDGVVVATGHKSEDGPNRHAELVALDKAAAGGGDLSGATAFVTLEPCANIKGNRIPCAQQLADAGVATVYIGRYDLNPRINRQGWKLLTERGILCRDFPDDLRAQLAMENAVFDSHFLRREGLSGTASFDHKQNAGRYELTSDGTPTALVWTTSWSTRGADSMYANGGTPGVVAPARYATEFAQIDDPGALDFSNHFAELEIGDIAVYRNDHGYALVRLLAVEAGPPHGETVHTSMKIDYELRPTETKPSDRS